MGRLAAQPALTAETQPALTAEERDWLAWARSIPASARELARYREPSFGGARAAPKAEAEARELYDAQQALTKAVMHAGDGGASPRSGDELLLHLTVRTADEQERLLSSTRAVAGGRDVPLRTLLGDSCTLLRGVELAVAAFTRGERAVLQLPPEFAYGHATSAARGLVPPHGVSDKQKLYAEVELLDFQPAKLVTDVGGLVTKRILQEGSGIETPHAPYEVELRLSCSLPAAWPEGSAQPAPATVLVAERELSFALGSGSAPPALEAAVASMRPGERAAVYCSPACALRPAAALPELPSVAADGVEYMLHLLSITQVRDLHGDGSLLKRRTARGRGDFPVDCPIHDCRVRIHVATRELPSRRLLADTRGADGGGEPLVFDLATGAQPPGLEAAVRLMVPGERACVTAAARHAYDAPGSWARPPGLPTGASVEWDVTLLDFERPVNWYRAEVGDILAEAARDKEAGVALYRQGSWALARARFEALASKLAGLRGLEGEEEAAATALRIACLLNAAAAAQQLNEHADAAARCTVVLTKIDAGCAKAMFRRAVSRTAMGEWEGAAEDLAAARVADPSAAADCGRQLAKLAAAQRAADAALRSQLRGFLAPKSAPSGDAPKADDAAVA